MICEDKMESSLISVRINNEEKKAAQDIASGLGMDLSTVVKVLLRQFIINKGIPFKLTLDPIQSGSEYVGSLKVANKVELSEDDFRRLQEYAKVKEPLTDEMKKLIQDARELEKRGVL